MADCLKTNTTITQVRRIVARPCVAHAVLLHCAAALRCCAPPGGWSVDISHEQITRVAVQICAGSLFVGVFCAMCVSWSVVRVCMWMRVTDTLDAVLCCPFMYALPREIFL